MNRRPLIALLLCVFACLCGPALGHMPAAAKEPPANPEAAAGGVTESATEARPAEAASRATAPLSPCMQAIQAVLDQEAARLAELEVRVKAAAGNEAQLALEREIERVKEDAELQILRVQADFARREGRVEQAAMIEALLAEMTAPRQAPSAPGQASGRTAEAPDAGARQR